MTQVSIVVVKLEASIVSQYNMAACFDAKSFIVPCRLELNAACFTGTSLIAVPVDVAEMLNSQIGAKKSWNGQYTVDCTKVPDLPDLTFYFNEKPYSLHGTDYVLEVQGTCISAFTGLDINLPGGSLWIIGTSESAPAF